MASNCYHLWRRSVYQCEMISPTRIDIRRRFQSPAFQNVRRVSWHRAHSRFPHGALFVHLHLLSSVYIMHITLDYMFSTHHLLIYQMLLAGWHPEQYLRSYANVKTNGGQKEPTVEQYATHSFILKSKPVSAMRPTTSISWELSTSTEKLFLWSTKIIFTDEEE